VSQQPYPGQPGQPGQPQPGGYPPPGQPGYPQGGYQQQQPGYGNYPGSPPPSSRPSSGNPLATAAGLAPILLILGYVVAVLGVLGGLFAFFIDGFPGSYKFVIFAGSAVAGLGFGGILVALSILIKRP
jgi:hypothetical protein